MVKADDPQSPSDNGPDSPLSAQSPTKKRKSIKKRVVSVKTGDKDGSRSKGEAYPPSDSWTWRKYGQKPIKGSPYPRGYYRCSSFKGCPARKQVERNRLDPTTLIITYAYEHNHPMPATKHHRHDQQQQATVDETLTPSTPTATPSVATTTTTTSNDDSIDNHGEPSSPPVDQVVNPFGDQSEARLEFVRDSSILESMGIEYSWISDVSLVEIPSSLMGPTCDDADMAVFSIKEEDEPMFGDLDELPECSVVFQRIGRCKYAACHI